jgi:AcrR family transcriptional regulator
MAASEERRSRIVDVAIRLAKARGFEGVGLREVAEEAGVALGTLYKTFRSKEEIMAAAVEHQTALLRRRFEEDPAQGATPVERIEDLFTRLTRALIRRPAYARIVLASIPSNHTDITSLLIKHEHELRHLIVAAIRGVPPREVDHDSYSESEAIVAQTLQQVWFACLVGWAGKITSQADVVRQTTVAGRLLMKGLEAEAAEARERMT